MKELRKFSRNTFIYLSSNVLRALLPFLLLPFLVRELGAGEYGRIGLITSAFAMLLPVIGLGVHAYVRTMYNRSSEAELRELVGGATALVALACAAVCLVLMLLGAVVSLPLPLVYIVVGAVSAFGQMVVSLRLALWQMADKPGAYGMLSVGLTLANLLLSITLVFLFEMQAEGRILGMWLPAVAAGPVIVLLLYRGGLLDLGASRPVLVRLLRFGLPLIPHNLALLFLVFLERAVLAGEEGGTALGIYFAAFQLAMPVSILARSVNLQFRVWSEKCMAEGEHRKVVLGSYGIMLLFLAAAAAYAWLLKFAYTFIVGAELASGYPIALILIFSAMFRGYYQVVVKGIIFARKTRPLMYLTVTLSALFSVLLLLFNDLYTVAWLNLGFNVALFLFIWLLSARVMPQPWLSFLRST